MLKALKLNNELRILREELKTLHDSEGSFLVRSEALKVSLEECKTGEDIELVNREIELFETEKGDLDTKIGDLETKISERETELGDLEAKAPKEPVKKVERKFEEKAEGEELRIGHVTNDLRTRSNPFKQSRNERKSYLQREEVKDFYEKVFELSQSSSKRGVNNVEIGIPEITMGLIRDSIDDFSQILKYVNYRYLKGDGRAIIAGAIPEAVWTAVCGKINELEIDFSDMNIYCHKVAGYIPVCNANLKDFDISGISSLAAEIEYNLLKGIGLALDKAIIYGDGINMPCGFVSSLAMTKNPVKSDEPWKDLTPKNVQKVTGTDVKLFKNIMKAVSASKKHTATSRRVFIMNETTWDSIIAPESLAINAAGTIVAAANNTFPVIGGDIIFLSFIPDGDIVGGYLENYILAEREGINLAMSEHVFFLEDNTVFKAIARFDGAPVTPYRDSFFAINVENKEPTLTADFAPDKANEVEPEETP